MSRWSVVVPTNRPERFAEFREAWGEIFERHDAELIAIFDGPVGPLGTTANWESIPEWIPRQTDMIRSWGIYLAWKGGSTYTVSLDDDVRPLKYVDPLAEYEKSFEEGAVVSPYLDVGAFTDSGLHMRGFPKSHRSKRPVAVQYGGWDGSLDYDAETQLAGVPVHALFADAVIPVPHGCAATCCAMNMAWRTEYAPLMWQLPLLDGRYNRWGDIWSGLIQKVVCDELGLAMLINGSASVLHERASDPARNLELEKTGYYANERLWEHLRRETPMPPLRHEAPFIDVFHHYAGTAAMSFTRTDPGYAHHFLLCLNSWVDLFK